ncbi:nitrous oxide reductase accessory protein NosL [Pseudothauera lacus]|uniref:Twin-arginine translocation pathway signal protein n=1 Tax=Pseudothauera lacus TaxID=2136175 RepID=A0A2T4IEF9_9RHOO|nr:nitrous oxide reductase accessory protein NosL [Pseudothauera lacus]PTD96162.1 twin-arginine translocation pathway signal protein [Pseudothauera lacus]
MDRRELLKLSLLGSAAAVVASPAAAAGCEGDGTPNQFIPKTAPDPQPLVGELDKYPKCPYCGMDRREHHRTRMLVHYSDDLADGVCSIHCLAISLSLNIDRSPKAIWGPDYAAAAEPRPLLEVDTLHYLIGADLPHAMTARSKHSFATQDGLARIQAAHGGTPSNFQGALEATYLDMAKDVERIRARRAERRRRAMEGRG